MPVLLALLALALLYLLRWTILEEPVGAAIEAAVLDATGVRVEVGTIHGSVLREIRVDGLRTVQPKTEGAVHSFEVDELIVRYRLADLLPFLSLTSLPLPRFTSPGLDIAWLERDELTAGIVVSSLSRAIPASLTIDIHGEAVVNAAAERSSTRFAVRLDALGDPDESPETRKARVELSNIDSPLLSNGSGDTLSLVFGLAPGRLSVRTDGEESTQEVRIDGALESSDADVPAAITRAHLTVAAGAFRARATADAQSAELAASLPADDRTTDLVNEALARSGGAAAPDSSARSGGDDTSRLVAGALELDATLRLPQRGATAGSRLPERSVVAELFSAPAALIPDAELSASIDARSWGFDSIAVERLASSGRWADGLLSIRESSAAVSVEGLDLSTPSEPDPGATISFERVEWDPAAQEARVEDLVVRGGGGRAQLDGIVSLTPDGSVLDNLRGDLGGRLLLDRPGEVIALLTRLGIAPTLPEGYSVGNAVAVDFALRGSRTDARIDVGLRVQEPAVPGFAFDTVEADASFTADSMTVNRLWVRTAEALGAGDGRGTGTVFRLDEPLAVSWSGLDGSSELGVSVGAFAIESELGTLSGSGSLAADRLEVELAADAMPLSLLIGFFDAELSAGASGAVSVSVNAEGSPDSPTIALRARGDSLAIVDERVTIAFDTVEADASVTADSVTVTRFRVRTAEALGVGDGDRPGTVFRIDEPFAVSWSGLNDPSEMGISVGAFAIESDLGTLTGSGSLADNRLEAELAASAIPLGSLVGLLDPNLSPAASGTVSLRVNAEGDPASPTVAIGGRGDSLSIGGEPVTIALDIRQEAGEIRLSTLALDLADLVEVSGTGSAPVAFGTSGLISGDLAAAAMRIDASLPGVIPYLLPDAAQRWPEATLDLAATLDGRAASVRARASGFERTGELTIVGLEPITEFQLTASIADVLDPSSTLTARLTSGETELAWVDADLDSGLSGEARLPVAELSHFAPEIDLPGGIVSASFRVPNDGAEATGKITFEDVMVKVSPEVPTLASLSGSLVYAEETIRIEDLTGEMGGAPVSLSGSYTLSEDEESPIAMRVTGRDLLLARTPDVRLRANTDVELLGRFESMRLSGNVGVTDALYTRPVQLFSLGTTAASPSTDLQFFGVDADWARSMLLDVAVTADRTIVMTNNLFDGALSADMTIGGNLAVPRPAGRVFTNAGTVKLPTARMNVEELELRFPADAAFTPQIRLAAATSVQGYAMNVAVDGQLPSVEVRIVSAPPLPTDEAILLLTTGSRSSELSFTPDVTGTLTAVGTVVGRQVLNQLSQQTSDEDLTFFERIDFEIERKRETGQIGEVGVEYQLDADENWVLRFDRREEERYTLQLAWRLWIE